MVKHSMLQRFDVSYVKPDEYLLIQSHLDRDAAHRWKLSNAIRKENISVQDKLIKYLRCNVGREVLGEELAYIANLLHFWRYKLTLRREVLGEELAYIAKNGGDWPRRTRELRTELGWPVKTKSSGRPDIPMGVYVLEEDKQAEVHDRNIKDDDRVTVLNRDGFKCRKCGWSREETRQEDPRHLLELHHLVHHVKGGKNDVSNLVTLCNVDHDTVHRNKMDHEEILKWLGVNHL